MAEQVGLKFDLNVETALANIKTLQTQGETAIKQIEERMKTGIHVPQITGGAQLGDKIGTDIGKHIKEKVEKETSGLSEKFKSGGEGLSGLASGGIGGATSTIAGMAGNLPGGAGIAAAVGALGAFAEKGEKAHEIAEKLETGFAATGLSGEKLDKELERAGKTADTLSNKYALNTDRIKEIQAQVALLGGANGKANDQITELTAGLEKMSGGAISADQIVRAFTKGLNDPEAQANLGRLTTQFPQLATALKGVTDPAQMTKKALEAMSPAFGKLQEQANGPLGMFEKFKNIIEQFMEKAGKPIFTVLSAILTPLGELVGAIGDILEPIFSLLDSFGGVKVLLWLIAPGFMLLVEALKFLAGLVKDYVVPQVEKLKGMISDLANTVSGAWDWLKKLVGATDDSTEAVKTHTEAVQKDTEAMQMNADAAQALADASVKAITEEAKKREAIALQSGKSLKEAEEIGLRTKIEGLKNTTAALRRAGEENYDLEIELFKAEEELSKQHDKKSKTQTDENNSTILTDIKNFIAKKNEPQLTGLAKQLQDNDATYKSEQDKLAAALQKQLITWQQFKDATIALNKSRNDSDNRITHEFYDKHHAEWKKHLEDERADAQKNFDDILQQLQPQAQQELNAENTKYAQQKALLEKFHLDTANLEKLHQQNIAKIKLDQLKNGNTAEGAAYRAGFAALQSIENQGFSWIEERLGASTKNQKTVWFGLQTAMVKSVEDSLAKIAEEQVAAFIKNLLFSQTSLATMAAAMIPGMTAISAAASTPATLLSIATLGGADLIGTAALGTALGVGKALSMTGFAKGGIIVGEKGQPEIISPAKEFSQFAVDLVRMTEQTLANKSLDMVGGSRATVDQLRMLSEQMHGIHETLKNTKTDISNKVTVDGTMKANGGEMQSAISHSTIMHQITRVQ